jgi:hypothetical protein
MAEEYPGGTREEKLAVNQPIQEETGRFHRYSRSIEASDNTRI